MAAELLIVGFGPVAGYKYSRCLYNAVLQGHLSRYHVVDRESQQQQVKARLAKLPIQPASSTYIPERVLQNGTDSGIKWLIQQGLFTKSENKKKDRHNDRATVSRCIYQPCISTEV